MQMLRMISGLVFLIRPLRTLSRLVVRPFTAIVQSARPTTALMRMCYVALGAVLLFLGAEWYGQRDCATALAIAGTVLLLLRRSAPLVAMRGTVRWFNKLSGIGIILIDGGKDMFVHINDIVDFGPWFVCGAPVAFKTRGGGKRTRRTNLGGTDHNVLFGRCQQVTSYVDSAQRRGTEHHQQDRAWPTWAMQVAGCPAPDMQVNDGEAQMPSDLLKSGWVRKGIAANGRGDSTLSDDPTAVAWSLCGAVNAVFEPDSREWKSYMDVLRRLVGHNLVRWNGDSGRTQEEVVAATLETEAQIADPSRTTPISAETRESRSKLEAAAHWRGWKKKEAAYEARQCCCGQTCPEHCADHGIEHCGDCAGISRPCVNCGMDVFIPTGSAPWPSHYRRNTKCEAT